MEVVDLWTGRHANALRAALRLTNEAMARELGTAVRTVAKWNAEPTLVQSPELQRALDTLLARAAAQDQRRFSLLIAESNMETHAAAQSEQSLANDRSASEVLSWLDDAAGWASGTSRVRVAAAIRRVDAASIRDRAVLRSRVGSGAIADFLSRLYRLPANSFNTYRAAVAGETAFTSVLTRTDWLDLAVPLGHGAETFSLDALASPPTPTLDQLAADAAVERLAIAFATGGRMTNSYIYRLVKLTPNKGQLTATVGLTEFIAYALTMDLLESETIDAIIAGTEPSVDLLPLRLRFLPTLDAVTKPELRICSGGPLALFAAARPETRTRRADFVLLVQERSGRVLNAANRLAVIPKAFHEPLVDYAGEVAISTTLNREMEEELFGRPEVDSTGDGFRFADPLHPSRLTPPFRWLVERPAAWRMECTGVGLNLVSGNFEFASLIVIEDETWWDQFGGSVQANWESEGLRQYSSLDHDLVVRLVHDASWSNEGLFAFLQGIRRLAEIGGSRVNLPRVEWEL